MKKKLFYSFLLLLPVFAFSQDAKLEILPFVDATTSIMDGQIEAGPVFIRENVAKGNTFIVKPYIRIPLTSKSENVLQIDRFSTSWRGVLSIQYTKDYTEESGNIARHSLDAQVEYGSSEYKYYPTGDERIPFKNSENSYGFELKYVGFFTKGASGAKQYSPQFRLRYSYDWSAADEVGVVNPPNSNGVVATADLIIDAPSVRPAFSPAFSLQIYPGKGSFSYSPTIYYDFVGNNGTNSPFGNLNRLRLESWVFFYPLMKDNPNVKFGVSPFFSIRTAGNDHYKKVEYGGIISVKFGTSFLQFL